MHALKEHRAVKRDIARAFNHYEDQRHGLGVAFAQAVRESYLRLRENPTRNAVRFSDIRRYNLRRFPYAIFYIVEEHTIIVMGILHVKRDVAPILESRQARS